MVKTHPQSVLHWGIFSLVVTLRNVGWTHCQQLFTPGGDLTRTFPCPSILVAPIILRNEHHEPLEAFFYQIDYAEKDSPSDEAMTPHARWRRQMVTDLAQDYVILDGVEGAGTYVGVYLALTTLESHWWGEGEVKIYLDGDKEYPTWCSTGSEDYFGGAWSFAGHDSVGNMQEQTYSGAFAGFPLIRTV